MFCFGIFWDAPSFMEAMLATCLAYRMKFALVVHDLIPIRHPSWFPSDYVCEFFRGLQLALRSASYVMTNSQHSASEVKKFAAEMHIEIESVHVLRFGDLIDRSRPATATEGTIRPELRVLTDAGFALMVGSIDVRKNQQWLVGVWERLSECIGEDVPALVLIGKRATKSDVIFNRLKMTAQGVRSRIYVFEDVADDELKWCYDNALFTLLPSLAEGWGLTVAESLAHGKLCLCSNVDAIPEVGGDLVWYFDPHDERTIFEVVHKAIIRSDERFSAETEIRLKFKPHNWCDTVAQISRLMMIDASPRGSMNSTDDCKILIAR